MLEIMKKRRSIRKFKDEPLTEAELRSVVDAGILAPSAKNTRPVEFFVLTDKARIEKLVPCRDGQSAMPMQTARAAVIVAARADKSDMWIEDASIAATLILLQAESSGLGACWVQIRQRPCGDSTAEKRVRELLNIPDDISLLCMIALGHPDEVKEPRDPEQLRGQAVHFI